MQKWTSMTINVKDRNAHVQTCVSSSHHAHGDQAVADINVDIWLTSHPYKWEGKLTYLCVMFAEWTAASPMSSCHITPRTKAWDVVGSCLTPIHQRLGPKTTKPCCCGPCCWSCCCCWSCREPESEDELSSPLAVLPGDLWSSDCSSSASSLS